MPSGQTVLIQAFENLTILSINGTMWLSKLWIIFNRDAIDVFFAAQVARQKGMPSEMRSLFYRGLRPSA
jgi:hypothetical protein